MSYTLDETKALIMDTFLLRKVEMNLMYKKSDDPEYPDRFWRVCLYKKFEVENDWKLDFVFDVDSLEQAIARGIVWESSNQIYEECAVPDRLNSWKKYRITVEEKIHRKEKWGELRQDKRAFVKYEILLSDGWIEDYSDSSCKLETALAFLCKRYYNMVEGGIPYHWDYHHNENPQPSDYPMFEYKGHLFKTTYFFPDQKCVCGLSDTYKNEYEGDNSIKIEVWDVRCFDKDQIHHEGTKLIYNGEVYDASDFNTNGAFIKESQIEELKQMAIDFSRGVS